MEKSLFLALCDKILLVIFFLLLDLDEWVKKNVSSANIRLQRGWNGNAAYESVCYASILKFRLFCCHVCFSVDLSYNCIMVWILYILIIQEKCIFKIAYNQRQVNTVPHLIFTQASPALQSWRLGHLGLKSPFCFYSTAQILRQVYAIPTLNHCKLKDILNMIKESISKHINIFSVLYSETFLNTPPKEIYPRIVISLDEY